MKINLAVIVIAIIGVLLVSGCTQKLGELTKDKQILPSSTKIDSDVSGQVIAQNNPADKPKSILSLKDEYGKEVKPDSVIIDNKDQQPSSRITIDGFEKSEHDIIIIVKGTKYKRSFVYDGNNVDMTLEEPVKTSVFVLKKPGASLLGVSVYSDAELKCTTDSNGVCNFMESPGKHSLKLQAPGLFVEELRQIDKNSNSFTFKVERKFQATVKVFDRDDTNQPIKGAIVKIGGQVSGETNSNGEINSLELLEGIYNFEASYNGVSETDTKEIISQSQIITLYLSMPKTIVVNAKDELDNTVLQDAEIYLDGQFKGKTDSTGKLEVKSIPNKDYNIQIKYKGVDKPQLISVSSDKREFTVLLKAPRSVVFALTDEETQKNISKQEVTLESSKSDGYISTRTTGDDGKVKIDDIFPGEYKLTLKYVETAPSKVVYIGAQDQMPITLNMPNPLISVQTAKPEWSWDSGKCKIQLYNSGNTASTPFAICMFYAKNSNGVVEFKGSSGIAFPKIDSNSQSPVLTTTEAITVGLGATADVAVVVYDTNPYTPTDKQKQDLTLKSTPSLAAKVLNDVTNYCGSKPDKCAQIAGTFVGTVLKTFFPV